jgi:RNA:NAD 2'-phosphotransferase (TPT1/KptA family)
MELVRSHKSKIKAKSSFKKVYTSLYRKTPDLKLALDLTVQILGDSQKEEAGSSKCLAVDSEGFCRIPDLVEYLKEHPELDYINSTHVTELYLKDFERKILINGDDRIKYKIVKYVKPPENLFFGTLESLKGRMIDSGIRSNTKGYIKLYATKEQARFFASKFVKSPNDPVVLLGVTSGEAFTDGLKFSTYIEGEYIVVQIDKKYIKQITEI